MIKGTVVTYSCETSVTSFEKDSKKQVEGKKILSQTEFLEIVHWYLLTDYARVRPIVKGSKNKGTKVRKDYLTEIKD